MLEFLAQALFVQVLRAAVDSGVDVGLLAALGDPRIGPTLASIHAAPDKCWSLEDFAKQASLGRTAFSERFKKLVGESPMRYLQQWRMQVAQDLLLDSDLSVAQIAANVGYESEVSFRQSFRKEMGTTPGRVRRSGIQAKKGADGDRSPPAPTQL